MVNVENNTTKNIWTINYIFIIFNILLKPRITAVVIFLNRQ